VRKFRETLAALSKRARRWLAETFDERPYWLRLWWYQHNWPNVLLACALSLGFVVWLVVGLPQSDSQSARWALSATAQSMAALVGLMFVGLTILWNAAETARTRLRGLAHNYFVMLKQPVWKPGIPVIEALRRQYTGMVTSGECPPEEEPSYYRHEYRTHLELLADICVLSAAVADYHKLPVNTRRLAYKMRRLGWTGADEEWMWGEIVMCRMEPDRFMRKLAAVFDLANFGMELIPIGRQLQADMIDQCWRDQVDDSVERLKLFDTITGWPLWLVFTLALFAIVASLLTVATISPESYQRWTLALPILLALIAIGGIVAVARRALAS
jgi:hypothetical protein